MRGEIDIEANDLALRIEINVQTRCDFAGLGAGLAFELDVEAVRLRIIMQLSWRISVEIAVEEGVVECHHPVIQGIRRTSQAEIFRTIMRLDGARPHLPADKTCSAPYLALMEDTEFDSALIASAFAEAALSGWSGVSVASAARAADLPLDTARQRFPTRDTILLRFGQIADRHALAEIPSTGPVRERLFDLLMSRFDAFQPHRDGLRALFRALPADPAAALLLADGTRRSMAWMLEAAGEKATGLAGALRTQGLIAVWLYALRAWEKDESADLSGTMAALDRGLARAEQFSTWLDRPKPVERMSGPKPFPDVVIADPAPPEKPEL